MSTKTHKKKTKKNTKNTKPKIDLTTWNTTNSDEVERRKIRAESERFTVVNQDSSIPYFSDYFVSSYQSKKRYYVEIRSLHQLINSCDCHDYKTSRLGTCKHVEAVLLALRKKGIKKFKLASEEGSTRVEIFLEPEHELAIDVSWPKNISIAIKETLQPFFSSDEKLLGNLPMAFNELTASISAMKPMLQKKIRVSNHIPKTFRF